MSENGRDPLRMGPKADEAHIRLETAGDVTIYAIANENVYPKQADEIAETIRTALLEAPDAPKALIDLSGVEFICSALIGVLVDLHQLARDRAGELKICVTGEHAAYTMKLVKLNSVMQIAGNRQALLDSF